MINSRRHARLRISSTTVNLLDLKTTPLIRANQLYSDKSVNHPPAMMVAAPTPVDVSPNEFQPVYQTFRPPSKGGEIISD